VKKGTSPVGVVTQRKGKKPKALHDGTVEGREGTKKGSTGAKKDSTAMATGGQNEGASGEREKGERAGEEIDAAVSETNNSNPGAIQDRTTKAAKGKTEQTSGGSGSGQGAGRRGEGRGGITHGGMGKLRVNIRGGGGPQEGQGSRDPTAASVAKPAETGCSDIMIKARGDQQQAKKDPRDSVKCGTHPQDAQREGTSDLISAASERPYDPMHSESNPIYVQQEDWRPYTEDTRNSSTLHSGKREGDTGQREANHDEDDARKTAAWRMGMMEGLSNESQQNEERTETATVDREAGHGTGLGSQPRRPHMANSWGGWTCPPGGWTCPPRSWVVHEDPEVAARPNKVAPGFHVYGDGSGWGPTPPGLGWGEDPIPGATSGWGSRVTERGASPPREDQDAARVDPGSGWGGGSAGRGWGDYVSPGKNTWGSRDTERGATPKELKEEDEEESQRACELINDLVEAEEKENQDGSQWAEDQGFTIRDANNQFCGCFSAWNNGEQCGEFLEAKCKRHKQGDGEFGVESAIGMTADKAPGLVHKGDRKGSNAKKVEIQSRDITRQLAEDTREKEVNQDEDGATVTAAGTMAELEGVNDESLRNEDKTEVILFKEGGFEPD
jgi:hypothetical protein